MELVGLDFESYYDSDYSLSKLTTEQYVRDPRFELIGVSLKRGHGSKAEWFSGTMAEIQAWLDKQIDWDNTAIVCHNAVFDGAILAWHLNRYPKLWIDTLSMARPRFLKTIGVSLAALAKHYKLGEKGTAIMDAKGKRRADFTPQELAAYGVYCCNDIELTFGILKELVRDVTASEMQVIDCTVRMFTEPKLLLNKVKLNEYLHEVRDNKQRLLDSVNADSRDAFMSNDLFAELLEAEGVRPPTKWSAKQGKEVYAFAKTDKGLKELLDHDSERVQALAACRLGVKTTIEETRTERLIGIAERGLFPVMLNYWGAGTGRFSGGDKVNPQNFKRGGKIREAIEAIPGHCIIASDLSQIEARILALVSGQIDLVDVFASKGDPYCIFATDVFGRIITKANKDERFLGKTCILGLGYMTGAKKLRETLRQGPGKDGVGGVTVPLEEAERIVKLYRSKYDKITKFWRACSNALDHMVIGGSGYVSAAFNIRYEGSNVILPNGAVLRYPGLELHTDEETGRQELRYLNRKRWVKIYGGLLCENIIQALARGVIAEYIVTVSEQYTVALQVHDEIVAVVPLSMESKAKEFIQSTMSTVVPWLPGLPVECETHSGSSYGECK